MNQTPLPGVVGAAIVPHAPQFLSLPETEDAAQVERVRVALRQIGDRLRALEPDCIVVLSNDHGDHFVTHCVPPFCVHAAISADGMHKHRGDWRVDGITGQALVGAMGEEGFDLAFTLDARLPTAFTIPYEFMGFGRDIPMLPVFVNAYVPPQPDPLRCHRFGVAMARALARLGKRTVLIGSGGLSHYPGTVHYPHPDVQGDQRIFDAVAAGQLSHMLAYDAQQLDRSGNVELRMALAVAGAVGNRVPFASLFEPSWHHVYAAFGWDLSELVPEPELIYPALPGQRVPLVRALFALRTTAASVDHFLDDAAGFCAGFGLDPDETEALSAQAFERLRDDFGIHALLTSGAATHIRLVAGKRSAT
ncbi:hypothetical protein N234_36990 [Ralstonia pickettii DTP0602]|nr:hypothetical protein N234_36990 [Ralstonia pickettii DTP0602]